MSDYYKTRYTFDNSRGRVWRALCEYLQKYIRANSDVVLDLGSGYCDFINNIVAQKKYAVDMNLSSQKYCAPDVTFINSSVTDLCFLSADSINVIFASNLLEHLDDAELDSTIAEFNRVLKKDGLVILMQPNFRYSYREYFDDYTHKKIFTDISLPNLLAANGFSPVLVKPKFLPFSLKSRLPKSYMLTKLYLYSVFKPAAKQMLVIMRKDSN